MRHVFISYVRENNSEVLRLRRELEALGITVWLDRTNIAPGQYWEDAIRTAIEEGNGFIACFSEEYAARDTTYMNEELHVAVQQLRRRPQSRAWFIPVLLSGRVPDWEIGSGRTLRSLQWADLSPENWTQGIEAIAHAIRAPVEPLAARCLLVSDGTDYAEDLGRLAASAGYSTETLYADVDDIDALGINVQRPYALVIISRGEHYATSANHAFYSQLLDTVTPSGGVLATPWLGFESQRHRSLRHNLPVSYKQIGFVENATLHLSRTDLLDSKELFAPSFDCQASFELLEPSQGAIVLLNGSYRSATRVINDVPVFAYHSIGERCVYYLNVCQHTCRGWMPSPIRSSPGLDHAMPQVFGWLHRRHGR
ncbi:MAG: toll/interleukin-1 receptor domain-containing protein [Rubrivivax sp.]|nr:toll/interleukin-1 receptor domain-containing protein [Rubrivivax sp.]